jgi:hypothetical protein
VAPGKGIDVLLVAGALSQRAFSSRERENRAEDKKGCGQTQPAHRRKYCKERRRGRHKGDPGVRI